MKRAVALGIGAMALAGMTTPLSAADIARRPPPQAPVVAPAPVLNWTGFYVGLGLGGRWTETDWTTTCLQPTLFPGCANFLFPSRFATNLATFDTEGFRVSGYAGFNWQIGGWVIGVEGDWGWADNEETFVGIPGTHLLTPLAAFGDFVTIRDEWDASIRGRLGFLFTPATLIYATGGATWLEKEITVSCGPFATSFLLGGWCSGPVAHTEVFSKTMFGWTIGGGLEWMFAPSWILRAEYRYSDYSHDNDLFRFLGHPATRGQDAFDFAVEQQTHTAYIGLSYLFNFGKGVPVTARY
jgi:outer membrane immunogenic protein